MSVPEMKSVIRWFEREIKPSDVVVIRVKDTDSFALAQYLHSTHEWHIFGAYGADIEVEEWWPLSERGTGNQCSD